LRSRFSTRCTNSGEKKLVLVADLLFTTAKTAGTAGSNHTNLLTGDGVALDSGGVTDVLVITTTVRVLNGVHSHTTDHRPPVALSGVLVVSTASFEHGLINTTTASDEANGGTSSGEHGSLDAGGHADTALASLGVVGNNGAVVTGGASNFASVPGFLLHVANNSTFGHVSQREDVADLEGGFFATVDKLSGVHTFGTDEVLLHGLELVRVAEGNLGNGSTSARVVHDLPDDTFDVAVLLGVVKRPDLTFSDAVSGVGLEDPSATSTLDSDNTSHVSIK
jgi:hypothetical protein